MISFPRARLRSGFSAFGVALALVAAAFLFAASAWATTIERVVSPGGIEAWLVNEPAVPLIAMEFAFRGGAAQDAPGKSGTATLVAALLDAGAGELDSKSFSDRLERKAIQLSFSAQRDTLRGTMRTMVENRDEAFDLLRLAMTVPRFDAKEVEISRPGAVVPAARDNEPRRYRKPPLVGNGLRRPPLWPPRERNPGHGVEHFCRRP